MEDSEEAEAKTSQVTYLCLFNVLVLVKVFLVLLLMIGQSSPGCSSEPGYFAAGDSIEGFAGISIGDKDDCAFECARVKGCVAWTFSLHNATE